MFTVEPGLAAILKFTALPTAFTGAAIRRALAAIGGIGWPSDG